MIRHTLEVNARFRLILRQILQRRPGSPLPLGMVASLLTEAILVNHNASAGH